ncbi:tRNA glutamyl-Q(34) synthetase GluQRS [Trueperella sp. LYQ143]|uniref:tRNA glutamyl-Q(34) synthetase GluQRS n=1 Tax=Trueperella sp. LYQ143 TaxID=3391059 RepID=UPI003983A869
MSGRYAPSPTGDLHLGNLRTAWLAWACARRYGLDFQVRMEDIDERSRPEFYDRQLADLHSLGIDWDGPVIYQRQRVERYSELVAQLWEAGHLYECYCTRRELAQVTSAPHAPAGAYPGTCRDLSEEERERGREKCRQLRREPSLRLRAEVSHWTVCDVRAGEYCGVVDDFVVRRGDGAYSYNFASVVDDAEFGVTQIVRGDDLLPSTARQVYLQQVLGYPTPSYIHVPLVLNSDGVRLAKRDGAVTLPQLAECGWSAEQVRELILGSLGLPVEVQPENFDPCQIPDEPWRVDVAALSSGPAHY